MHRKILVAIDGSIYSSNSLDYLIRLFKNDRELTIHLFSVVSAASGDQNWMFDVDPLREHSPTAERRKEVAKTYLEDAESRLIRNGFQEDQVASSVEITPVSPGQAIRHQAAKGLYDGLLVGRRGMGKVGEMLFGSVSSHLVQECHQIPLWIIDGEVLSTHVLLAVHTLPASLMAADHLAFILGPLSEVRIHLYHSKALFSRAPSVKTEDFYAQWDKEWCQRHLDLDNYLIHAHTQILIDGGIASQRIIQIKPEHDINASHDLLHQARRHRCGTLVLGRRGRPAAKTGMLGGVSDRIMQQAHDMAVWLVGS